MRSLLLLPLVIALFSWGALVPPGTRDAGDAMVVAGDPPCDSVPGLNLQIIGIVRSQIGTTVDRGECWDLAALVLNTTGAKWDKRYNFGRKVNPEKECVFPGDLIQFEGVKIKYTRNDTVFSESMGHHTAVINEVKAKGIYVLAHQNTGTSGRKVGLSNLDLKTIIKGEYQIFRPVR
jgi:hypothetical protein